ncbi:MAG: XRE family transcriptional regulator [Candidatus Moranbacteria bacterium]|nr:XRE family transcriptional regulator [Candidatus Moranbacteria bacterium]
MQPFFYCLSKKIKKERKKRNLKQREVADFLGIKQPRYSQIERNPENLTLKQLEKIEEFLQCEILLINQEDDFD